MNKDIFAEIEYEEPITPSISAPDAELLPSPPLNICPIRQLIYDMRSLASDNPFKWGEAGLFYKQAKFMENFTDDYDGYEELAMHSPTFQRLGYESLRTYFTWRTKVRRGEFPPIDISYVFLNVYELIMLVGAESPSEARCALVSLWNAYKHMGLDRKGYLPAWLKDFHVYYGLDHDFLDFAAREGLLDFYSEDLLFDAGEDDCLPWWNKLSSYNVENSSFYKSSPKNARYMKQCFHAVVCDMDSFFRSKGSSLKEIFVRTDSALTPWHPFRGAVFYPWQRQSDREAALPGETYVLQDNLWKTHVQTPYFYRKLLVGFFIKQTEAHVRKLAGYKTGLKTDISVLYSNDSCVQILDKFGFEPEKIIERAVRRHFAELNRVVVRVDLRNLERIREEAEEITDKLVVLEEEPACVPVQIGGTEPSDSPTTTGDCDNEWVSFVQALTLIELDALRLALENPGEVKNFAASRNIMPEVLADGINEKAFDIVGDNVLEMDDMPMIYDDYREFLLSAIPNRA